MVVVEHDHLALGQPPGHDIVGSKDPLRWTKIGDARGMEAVEPVAPPCGAGCDHNVIGPDREHVVRAELAFAVNLDIGHAFDLLQPVIADTRPLAQARQPRFRGDPAAELAARLGEHDDIAPLSQGARAFQTGGPGPDDQHFRIRALGLDLLGMPAAPPFLVHGRVLCAPDRHALTVAGIANVAADALADVFGAALLDLLGQKGIGDGRPGRADEINDAPLHLTDHGVRRGETADRHHRFRGHRLHVRHVGLERTFLDEAGDAHLVRIVVDVDVPEVRQLGQHLEYLASLTLDRRAVFTDGVVGREADSNGAAIAHCLLGLLDQLADQADPVLQTAAVFVAPGVEFRREEMGQQVAVGRVDVDDVETRRLGPQGRFAMPLSQRPDIRLVHGPGLIGIAGMVRHGVHTQGNFASEEVGGADAAEPKLGSGQRPVLMHLLGHQCVGLDVAVVPQAR